MKILTIVLVALLPIQRSRADVVACDASIPPGVICLTGDISDTAGGGPLVAGQVYHLAGFPTVPNGQVLTIEDGAILKFHPGAQFVVSGTLNAGAAILTSLRDDTAGGDTNGDGPSVGMPGDWNLVSFLTSADASVVSGVELRFASTGITLAQADVTLDQVRVRWCSGSALVVGASAPTVTGCQFMDNGFAVDGVPLRAIPGFSGCTASGNLYGDYMHVTDTSMDANLVVGPQNSLGSAPFVVCKTITVPAGLTLDVQPGVVIKFGVGPYPPYSHCGFMGIDVEGTLLVDGVTLTSVDDDSVGGDTRKDGATQGFPGDWGRVYFGPGSDASRVEDTTLRFGGAAVFTPYIGPLVELTGADVLLDDVRLEWGAGAGLRLGFLPSFPIVQNCRIAHCGGIAVDGALPAELGGFDGNTAEENGRDYVELLSNGAHSISGVVSLSAAQALNQDGLFVLASSLTVPAGSTLILGDDVVFKWKSAKSLTVGGTLLAGASTPFTPIRFTSVLDDSVLGDTNEDGSATQPMPGDWVGIHFMPGSDASSLDHVLVDYAGDGAFTNAAIRTSGTSPRLEDTIVRHSETAGLDLLGPGAYPTVVGCEFSGGDRAVINASIRALPGLKSNSAAGNAKGDYVHVSNGDVSVGAAGPSPDGALEIGPANSLNGDGVLVLADDVDVPVGYHLSVLPGTILKFDGSREVDVDGSLTVGGIGAPVVLTSLDDDSAGGDTANDGATQGSPGDWRQVHVSDDGSYFENVLVRYAGGGGVDGVRLVGCTAQLKSVSIDDCAGAALGIPGSTPLVDGCQFNRNARAVNEASIRALPGFSNNASAMNALGDYVRITDGVVTTDVLVSPTQSPGGIPFVLAAHVDVLVGATLTLDPSVVFKFDGNRAFSVQGTLSTNAAPGSIVLTSLLDDISGDTNKDMGATVPVPGLWTGLQFQGSSDASVLAGARVRYAGALAEPAIRLFSADIQILDTSVEFSGGDGLRLSSSRPQVRRSAFDDGLGIPINFASLPALAGFTENTASGNLSGDSIRVGDATLAPQMLVERRNSLNSDGVFVVDVSISLSGGQSLELRQGTVFKFQGNRSVAVSGGTLTVEGTGLEPVVFTSIHDDAIVGDTQKDGSAVRPSPGDWNCLLLNNFGMRSRIEHLHARYGGSSSASLQLYDPLATTRSLRSDFSATDGIRAANHSGDAVNWIAAHNAGDGIDVSGGNFDLLHVTSAHNGGAGVRRAGGHLGALRNSIAFANGGGELAGFSASDVWTSDAGAGFGGINGNIHADPMFVDAANGDFSLGFDSPCIDAADFDVALAVIKDHREASRILDHDLDGVARADMGALERAVYELEFGGSPETGTVMSFTVLGDEPGLAIFRLGLLGGETFVPPFGFTLHGPPGSGAVFGVAPVGQSVELAIPHQTTQLGVPFGVQATVHRLSMQIAAAHGPRDRDGVAGPGARARPIVRRLGSVRSDLAVSAGDDLALQSQSSGSAKLPPGTSMRTGNATNLYRARVLP